MTEKTIGSGRLLRLLEIKVLLISLAHGITDMYAGFLPTFIPYIKENLNLSYALAGSFNMIVGFCHIFCQPLIGYLCDRIRRPWLMIVGPLLCGMGAVMIPSAPSYWLAFLFAGLWGLGSALYHPQGGGGIGYVSRPETLTRSLTIFNIAGTAGSMFSPVLAVFVVRRWGYAGLRFTLIPVLLLAPLIYFAMPLLRDPDIEQQHEHRGMLVTIASVFAVLYPVWAVSTVRDFVFMAVRFFLPLKIAAEGGSLESVGSVVFCVTLGGTLSMIPAGIVAKKFGRKKTLAATTVISSLFLLTAAFAKGLTAYILYVTGVACIYSTMAITVSMAQELVPNERSEASSIVTGLAWGFSNVMLSPLGRLADYIGIDATYVVIGLLPLLSVPFLFTKAFRKF